MAIQSPEFRPRAGGDGTIAGLERFQARAAPVRRPDPVAPMSAGGVRAPTQRNVDALVQSLSGLNRQLAAAAAAFAEEHRKTERGSAEADATALSLRNQDVNDWAEAVAADPSLAGRSPYYRQIFEERLARASVARQANAVFAEYFNSDMAGSPDPAAIQGWLSERLGGALERYRNTPAAAQGAAEELRQQAQTLTRMHQQRAAQNLVQQNEDSIESRVNSLIDGFAARGGAGRTFSFRGTGQDPGGLATSLQQVEAEARAQGVSGARLNTLMSRAVAAAAIRHGREDLLELGARPRPDGTPGFGTTLDGRNVIEGARQTILNRAVARQNLAWTQEQRARAVQQRQISSQVIELFTRQMEAGQTPSLTPDLIRQIGQANPDAVPGLLSLQGTLQSQARSAEDPSIVGRLELQALRGQLAPEDIINSRGPNGWTSPETMQRLVRAAESARENSAVLAAPAFRDFVRNTMTAALGLEASGELRDSPAAANIERYILEQTASFWRQNPSARNDVVTTLDHLMGVRDRIVGVFNPNARLPDNRVETLLERGSRNPPAPPSVGGRPVIAPARGADWRTQPAFPSRAALEQAWQGYSTFAQNPTGEPDPANPIFRWIAEGQVDPATFYRRQRDLLTRLERQPRR